MTFAFFSNFLNHHQLPLCLAWHEALGDAFTFVATQPFARGDVAGSYQDMNNAYPFCLAAYESEAANAHAQQLANESDVVLYGAAPIALFRTRIAAGKLTFRYSERIFKPYYMRNRLYTYACAVWECWHYAKKKNTWLLSAGAYAAADFASVGGFCGRALRWGYFPEVETVAQEPADRGIGERAPHDSTIGAPSNNAPISLLWAGRMISYKHAERVLPLLSALQEQGVHFALTMVGDGPLRETLEQAFAQFGNAVCFAGTLSVPHTRALMRASDIFLFTSDESEGWGAVLSEAMADGCAVLASNACGASPYLIQDGENGVLFADGNAHDFVQKGLALAQSAPTRARLSTNAARTMREHWNAHTAAARFLQTSKALREEAPLPHWMDGPCSKAPCIKWKHRRNV